MQTHPLARLWPALTPELREALASVHRKNGQLSTSKAAKALRSMDGVAAKVLDQMAKSTKVPDRAKLDRKGGALPDPLETSPCVRHTAEVLLGQPDPIDDGQFLAALAKVSTGSTAARWQADGFDADKVAALVNAARKER